MGAGRTRRSVLAGLAACGTFATSSARADTTIHRLSLGELKVTILTDGILSVPITLALPNTPPAEIEAVMGAETLRQGIRSQVNVVMLEAAGRRVLIDGGAGENFMATAGQLPKSLEAAGIEPDSITDVVLSHAHPDHLWGLIDEFDGQPRFAKARHFISAVEWDYWTNPETVRRVPEGFQAMAAGSNRILRALEPVFEHVTTTMPIPFLNLLSMPGHTPGHMLLRAQHGGETLFVGADIATHPQASFARPDWRWGMDVDAAEGVRSRRRLLDLVASERALLAGYHLPWPGVGRVERAGTAYRYVAG